MNYLGIDYGHKRIGLSFGDELGIAVPGPALAGDTGNKRFRDLKDIIQKRRIHEIVIGYPYNMDGSVGFKAKEVDDFIVLLEKHFALPVHRVDERLTTHQVLNDFKSVGKKTKTDRKTRNSGEIDSAAATLILQDYLNQNDDGLLPPPPGTDYLY